MKTNVEFIEEDDKPDFQLFHRDKPRWKIGDKGVVDGYVSDQYGEVYAIVIMGQGRLVSVKLHFLKVTSY